MIKIIMFNMIMVIKIALCLMEMIVNPVNRHVVINVMDSVLCLLSEYVVKEDKCCSLYPHDFCCRLFVSLFTRTHLM